MQEIKYNFSDIEERALQDFTRTRSLVVLAEFAWFNERLRRFREDGRRRLKALEGK